ncbi:hypothetical protein ACFQ0B_44880 [Nonomuraea thailandensis]
MRLPAGQLPHQSDVARHLRTPWPVLSIGLAGQTSPAALPAGIGRAAFTAGVPFVNAWSPSRHA